MHHAHPTSFQLRSLNGRFHERALQLFMLIVLAHLSEHLVQAAQVYLLDWPRHNARGILGQWFPGLVHTEALHYGYAVIMLAGIWLLLPGFVGRSRAWWVAALVIQFWHHIEHALLQGQALLGSNLFGAHAPMSIAQLWIPRVELHLLYNSLVFVPMVAAMFYHMFPAGSDAVQMACSCARRPRRSPVQPVVEAT